MLFDVEVCRVGHAVKTLHIEAETRDEATARALTLAPDEDFSGCTVDYDYEVDGTLPYGGSHAPDCPYRHGGECLCWRSNPMLNPELGAEVSPLECVLCQAEIEDVQKAIDAGWYPDYWTGDTHQDGPVCPECQAKYLTEDESGEFALKPEYRLGEFVSVWDDGAHVYRSQCLIHLPDRTVKVLEVHDAEEVASLDEEYVILDGARYQACPAHLRPNHSVAEPDGMFFWE